MESEEHMVVERSLDEWDAHRRETNQPPFSKPGWLEELFAWTRTQIDPLGLRATGTIRQLNASPTFSLIHMETTGPAIWFKATGEPNRHELPIAVALARLFPGYVPRILGVHSSWNGWLSEDAPGTLLDDCEGSFAWERVARQLAELQLDSAGKSTELLGNSCKDLRLPGLVKMVDPFLARMADLMAVQVKASPKPLTTSGLNLLGERLKEACALLHELDLPDTLGHVDFNPGNIVVSPNACCFLDWAEGCVSHPFLTFEYLREHARRRLGEDGAAIERIAAAYLGPWQSQYSPETVRQAMLLSPLVAVFGAAVNDSAWRSVDPLQELRVAGYFRSLTRRMSREAAEVTEERERCLS
jgi:phosphotransferase family enzyme